uniref:Uncharacterized protein n=1 Tax=Anguilla anguilla TaxID=7936 RepID=A0A0E9Q070_ANGAN
MALLLHVPNLVKLGHYRSLYQNVFALYWLARVLPVSWMKEIAPTRQ